MSDPELLDAYLTAGDHRAFARVVERHGPMVLRVCRDILGDLHLAEDAFQTTFLVLARRGDQIRDPERLGRWLYGVSRRVAVRARVRARTMQQRTVPEIGLETLAMPGSVDDPIERELRPLLHEEVDRLPQRLRSAIVLCYFEGLTQEQAAARIGCPVGTLKGRLLKARGVLGSRLRRRGLVASSVLLLLLLMEESPAISAELVATTTRSALRSRSAAPAGRPRVPWGEFLGSRSAKLVGVLVVLATVLGGQAFARSRWMAAPPPPPDFLPVVEAPAPGGPIVPLVTPTCSGE